METRTFGNFGPVRFQTDSLFCWWACQECGRDGKRIHFTEGWESYWSKSLRRKAEGHIGRMHPELLRGLRSY